MHPSAQVLLVEDDSEQAALFSQLLTMSGHHVTVSPTAEAALAHLAEAAFDVLVVDWDLPGMNGDALIQVVKSRYPALKTILYSNHSQVNEAAQTCAADRWFCKNDNILRLRQIIADLVAIG